MKNKQLFEKQANSYNPFFPLVRLEDIIETITDKSIQWIFNNYNHIYVEYSESREITRNKVPQLLRRSGLWISYNNGKDNITEHYIGENTDVNNYVEWTSDDNWKKFDELTIQDKSITYQHLSDALRQLIAGGNTITNFPDEEDITTSGGVLSFKDRDYNPNTFSGLGRVILRKNLKVVDGQPKNILTQDMINKENTIYEIRYDFDLGGQEITIPEGCVLDFQGGSLSNGTVDGNNTITYNFKLNNLKLFGTFCEKYIYYIKCIKLDDHTDYINNIISHFYNSIIEFEPSIYNIDGEKSILPNSNIYKFNGAILKQINTNSKNSEIIKIAKSNIVIDNVKLIGDYDNHTVVSGTTDEWNYGIMLIGNKTDNYKGVENIVIQNSIIEDFYGDCLNISAFKHNNIVVKDCILKNGLRGELSVEGGNYINVENCRFIHDKEGYTLPGFLIDIETYTNTPPVSNVTIQNNIFKTNVLRGVAINVGGKNTVSDINILNNLFDIAWMRYTIFSFGVVAKDVTFKGNYTHLHNYENIIPVSNDGIYVNGSTNLRFENNVLIADEFSYTPRIRFANERIINCKFENFRFWFTEGCTELIETKIVYTKNISNRTFDIVAGQTFKMINSKIVNLLENSITLNNNSTVEFIETYLKNINCNNKDNSTFIAKKSTLSYVEFLNVSDAQLENNTIYQSYQFLLYSKNDYIKFINNNIIIDSDINKSIFSGVFTKVKMIGNIITSSYYYKHCFSFENSEIEITNNILNLNGNGNLIYKGGSNVIFENNILNYEKIINADSQDITQYEVGVKGFHEMYKIPIVYNGIKWTTSEGFTVAQRKGKTSETPTNLDYSDAGYVYFNTTLNKPIWWTGSKWVDATGAEV